MAIYSGSWRTSVTTTSNANIEIIAGTNTTYRLLEFGFTQNTGTASVYGFGVPAAIGSLPSSAKAVVAEDGGNTTTANTTVATAWTTSPTVPNTYSRRVSMPATVGAGIVWTFPRGFTVLKALSTTCVNIGATVALDTWCVVDE
jgi:hypothetical protein